MPPDSEARSLEAEVAGLQSRVDALGDSVNRNTDATTALRTDVARLRGELNGTLPRIDRNVELLATRVQEYQEGVRSYQEQTQVHEHEIQSVMDALGGKADRASNDEAHKRLWFVIKASLIAIATGAVAAMLIKAFEI